MESDDKTMYVNNDGNSDCVLPIEFSFNPQQYIYDVNQNNAVLPLVNQYSNSSEPEANAINFDNITDVFRSNTFSGRKVYFTPLPIDAQFYMVLENGHVEESNANESLNEFHNDYKEEEDKDTIYVNSKQFLRILKRRQTRAKLLAYGRIPPLGTPRKRIMYVSRSRAARKRIRLNGGIFSSLPTSGIENDVQNSNYCVENDRVVQEVEFISDERGADELDVIGNSSAVENGANRTGYCNIAPKRKLTECVRICCDQKPPHKLCRETEMERLVDKLLDRINAPKRNC